MSLINDALKRASQTDKRGQLPSGAPRVVAPAAAERNSFSVLALAAVVTVLAAAGVWLFWRQIPVNHDPASPISAPATPGVPPPAVVATPEKIPAPPPKTEPALPVTVTTAPPSFPPLQLQAIFFSRSHPRALINGRTLEEGDEVEGTRVIRIEADRVTLEWRGQSNVIAIRGP